MCSLTLLYLDHRIRLHAVWPGLRFVSPHYCLATGAKLFFFSFGNVLVFFFYFLDSFMNFRVVSWPRKKTLFLFKRWHRRLKANDTLRWWKKKEIVIVSTVLAVCVSVYRHKYLILISSTESPFNGSKNLAKTIQPKAKSDVISSRNGHFQKIDGEFGFYFVLLLVPYKISISCIHLHLKP